MKPWVHLLLSLILAVVLYPIFSWKVLFILVGGVLIDIDHYFWCIFKHKNLNFVDCYRFHSVENIKNNYKDITGDTLIFHTIEFLIASIILSFYFKFMLIFTIGVLLHYFLDLLHYCFVLRRFVLNHSIISWFLKNKIQKHQKS